MDANLGVHDSESDLVLELFNEEYENVNDGLGKSEVCKMLAELFFAIGDPACGLY